MNTDRITILDNGDCRISYPYSASGYERKYIQFAAKTLGSMLPKGIEVSYKEFAVAIADKFNSYRKLYAVNVERTAEAVRILSYLGR